MVARRRHGAQERLLELGRGASPEQAHGVLHDRGVAGQHDPAAVAAREAELLPRHPQELREDGGAEEGERHLEPRPVGRVHRAVALALHRGAALVGFLRSVEALPPERRHPLPLLGQLSDPLGADHGWLSDPFSFFLDEKSRTGEHFEFEVLCLVCDGMGWVGQGTYSSEYIAPTQWRMQDERQGGLKQ